MLQTIDNPAQVATGIPPSRANAKDFFADLSALRLSYGEGILAQAKEHVSRVPVEKPSRQDFWRAHPDDGMTLITSAFENKEAREFYVIAPQMTASMLALDAVTPVKLVPTINRQGVLRLLPAKLPNDASGSLGSSWQDTLLVAIERAKTRWVRISADMALGGYRIYEAQGKLSDPTWPEMSLNEMLQVGFKDRIIDNEDHPIFNRLLGRL
jgi:hypothetical protein